MKDDESWDEEMGIWDEAAVMIVQVKNIYVMIASVTSLLKT